MSSNLMKGTIGSTISNSYLYDQMLNQTLQENNNDGDLSQSAIQERLAITPITHRMDDTIGEEDEDVNDQQ